MKPRFSISNLLLLTALIAMALGWYLDRTLLNEKYQATSATLGNALSTIQIDEAAEPYLDQRIAEALSVDKTDIKALKELLDTNLRALRQARNMISTQRYILEKQERK
jgi:hypothetical protein